MKRIYDDLLLERLTSKRMVVVKGPKFSGKANYIQSLVESFSSITIWDCEDKKTRKTLNEFDENVLRELIGVPFVLLKEAQSLITIQELIEAILAHTELNCTLVITSSYQPLIMAELMVALKMEDAVIDLYPPLFQEIANKDGLIQLDQTISQRLIYGNYTAVIDSENPEEELNSIIERTIFTHLNPNERINKRNQLFKALQFISFKLGETISYNEIGFYASLDNETVERYIDLLTKAFVLIKLPTYYTGKRYELKKGNVFYFFDNGIRNALIQNLNPVDLRIDVDVLWKNWLISERIKWNYLLNKEITYYCWKTNTKQSVDLIEVKETGLTAYQMLYDKRKKAKFPKSFQEHYPDTVMHTINKSTYWVFLTKKN